MKRTFKPAWEFLQTAGGCKTLDELQTRFASALAALEFDQFSCAIARGERGKPVEPHVLFGQANRNWDEHYLSQGYLPHDPCVRQLFVSPLKYYAWSDIPHETGIARDMREDAAEHGLRNGFVVPVPGENGELYGVRMMTPEPTFDPDARNLLNVMATLYCVIGVERLNMIFPESKQTSPLSPREAECLSWVSEGKSDWDIAEILQISQWTVHEHVERAKSKIGVRSRTKAAVVAAGSGWITSNPSR